MECSRLIMITRERGQWKRNEGRISGVGGRKGWGKEGSA